MADDNLQGKPVEPVGWDYFTVKHPMEGGPMPDASPKEWFRVGGQPGLIVTDDLADEYARYRVLPGQWEPMHCTRCGNPKHHGRLACRWRRVKEAASWKARRIWLAITDRRGE